MNVPPTAKGILSLTTSLNLIPPPKPRKHLLYGITLYRCWYNMKNRCQNPNVPQYRFYGDRGVMVCPTWKNCFLQFYNDALTTGYQPGLSIDRIDPAGDYTPENIRWSTREAQARNRRNTKFLEAFGERKTMPEWSQDKRCSVSQRCIYGRIRIGWPPEKAIQTPKRLPRKT